MRGLYICKTYWAVNGKIVPVLKYGKTNNIETRMKYYNKEFPRYKLISFFPCDKFLDFREYIVHEKYEEYRMSKTEHLIYESGSFKRLYREVKEASNCKITRTKNPLGAISLLIED